MIKLTSPNGGYLNIDMWYGDKFAPKRYGADSYFSDADCVYRGNIYDDAGKVIGDYESDDSVFVDKNFLIDFDGSTGSDSYDKITDTISGATDGKKPESLMFYYDGQFLGSCNPDDVVCDDLYDLLKTDKEAATTILNYMNSLGDPVFPAFDKGLYVPETNIKNIDIGELYSVFLQELQNEYYDGYDVYMDDGKFEIFVDKTPSDLIMFSSNQPRYTADMCSIGASDDEYEQLVEYDEDIDNEPSGKYHIYSYYGTNYSGLEDDFITDDPSQAVDWIWDHAAKGGYIELRGPDGVIRLDPDDLAERVEMGDIGEYEIISQVDSSV